MKKLATLDFLHSFLPGRSARTLLLLHGTGGNETDLIPLGQSLDPEASLLSPRGKVIENGMPRFFRRLAEGIFDEEDLIRRTHELADFIEQASVTYAFDRKKLLGVGYSNGANIASSLMLLRLMVTAFISNATLIHSARNPNPTSSCRTPGFRLSTRKASEASR